MYAAPGGSPFIEHYLRMMLTRSTPAGSRWSGSWSCAAGARPAARVLPAKGSISVGADADLVVLDMDHEEVLHADQQSLSLRLDVVRGPWLEGSSDDDHPCGGEIIMRDGEVTAAAGSGQVLTPPVSRP